MPHTLIGRITYLLFFLISFYAIIKGDRPARIAGAVLLIANVLSPLIQDRVDWMDPQSRALTMDGILLIFSLGLTIHFGRAWIICAAAFQLLSTLSHPAAHFARRIGPFAYISVFQLFSYGVYFSLGLGVLIQSRQRPPIKSA